MRLGAWRWLVVAAVVAGCTLPGEPPAEGVAPDAGAGDAADARDRLLLQTVHAVAPPEGERVPVEVSLSTSWAKPFLHMRATVVQAPGDAEVSWFVGARDGDVRLTSVREESYVNRADNPNQHHERTRTRADVGELVPGEPPRRLTFVAPGRYLLAADDGSRVNVTVRADAPEDAPTQTFLFVDEARGGRRFVPQEVDVRPGTSVLFWNQADRTVTVGERAHLVRLGVPDGEDSRNVSFTPVDEGIYDVHALVRDGATGARGHASAPFLVDFERPRTQEAIGPWSGRFVQAGGAVDDPERVFPLNATYEIERLRLRVDADSRLPEPGVVRLDVRRGEALVASWSSLDEGPLVLRGMTAGAYELAVRPEEGSIVDYGLSGDVRYRLPLPPVLRDEA